MTEIQSPCKWIAYVKLNGEKVATKVNIGTFPNWLKANNNAVERFGANCVVLVEPR